MEKSIIATDSITCPNCGSEMVRDKTDNLNSCENMSYTCFNCDSGCVVTTTKNYDNMMY
jgi:DNA-directed RNA polymerase subunit RPC12/RpoP